MPKSEKCDNLSDFQTLWTCIQKHKSSVNCPLQSSIPKKCALRSSVHTYPLNLSKTENNIPHLHFFRRRRFSKTTSYAIDWKSPVFLGYKRVLLPRTSSTIFENHSKCRTWFFPFLLFPLIFVLLKVTRLETLFDRKHKACKNSSKLTIFWHF